MACQSVCIQDLPALSVVPGVVLAPKTGIPGGSSFASNSIPHPNSQCPLCSNLGPGSQSFCRQPTPREAPSEAPLP